MKNEEKFSSQLGNVAKKTTVAASVAGLCAVAGAATIVGPGATYSLEGAAQRAAADSQSSTSLGTITITITGTYQAADEITFTLGSDVVGKAAGSATTLSCTAGSALSLTDESSANIRSFRVPLGATASGVCTLNGVNVLDSSLDSLTDVITISSQSKTQAGTLVDAGSAAVLGTVVNQLQVAVNATTGQFNGQIDAKAANRLFTTAGGSRTVDVLTVAVTKLAVTGADATLSTASTGSTNPALVIDVTGNFNFLKNTGETTGSYLGGANSAAATCGALTTVLNGTDITGLKLSIESGNVAAATNCLITVGVNDGSTSINTAHNQLSPVTFSAGSATFNLKLGSAANRTDVNAFTPGGFTASGATVFVPFMPVRSDVTNILYLTNNSAVEGTATMSIKGTNGTCTSSSVSLPAGQVANLGNAFASALSSSCVTSNDKVSITVTATTPVQNTEVFSAYAIGNADRLPVINSSNGYKTDADTGVGSQNANNAL